MFKTGWVFLYVTRTNKGRHKGYQNTKTSQKLKLKVKKRAKFVSKQRVSSSFSSFTTINMTPHHHFYTKPSPIYSSIIIITIPPSPHISLSERGNYVISHNIFGNWLSLRQQEFQFAQQLQVSWKSLLISWKMMKKPSISSLLLHHSQSVLACTLGYNMECSLCTKLQKYPSKLWNINYNSLCTWYNLYAQNTTPN